MDVEIGGLRNELLDQIASAADPRALEELRVAALGKKGRVTELVKQLGTLPPEQRREAGQAFNTVKRAAAYHRHMMTGKPQAAKASQRKARYLAPGDAALVKLMLPYA